MVKVESMHVAVAPPLLGGGVRLFDGLGSRPELDLTAEPRDATHLSDRVRR